MTTTRNRLAAAALLLTVSWLTLACDRGSQTNEPTSIFVSGRIEGDETNVGPKQGGRVVEVLVREGDAVQTGDVLVRLSGKQILASRQEAEARVELARRRLAQARQQVPVLEARREQVQLQEQQARLDASGRVSQAEGQLAVAEAELARAQADLEQNIADARRYGNLAEKGAVPIQQAEQLQTRVETSRAVVAAAQKQVAAAKGALEVAQASLTNPQIRVAEQATLLEQIQEARASVRSAQAEVEAIQASLSRAEADVEDLSVAAPFDGLVITRSVEPGQMVSAGTTLLTMVDPTQLYLRGFVPEGQIGHVKVGQRAEVYLDSAPKSAIPAEIMRVDPEAMFTPENTYFQEDRVTQVVGVKILLQGGFGNAKLGMPADARILLEPPEPGES